jgi:Transcriptional regulator containing PAS, AAA-type ATPase, and DNA-binding domains
MTSFDYFSELPIAITICDNEGIILYMNAKSQATFAKDGGAALIGKSLLDCHPGASKEKLKNLLKEHRPNSYTIEKNGIHKMIHQTPWFENGQPAGLIEFSFEIPAELPHFVRA